MHGNRWCEGVPTLVLDFTANAKEWPKGVSGDLPVMIYKRGMWFDGANRLEIENFQLNHSMTIQLWLSLASIRSHLF